MYIKKVSVKGFKSLADFELELSPFTCLIGLNGCGKSTVLQFFDFISYVIAGDVGKWYEAREWEPGDVGDIQSRSLTFETIFSDDSTWSAAYETGRHRCIEERISVGTELYELKNGKTNLVVKDPDQTLQLAYRGSITNLFLDEYLPESVRVRKSYFRDLRAFDTLAPQYLRRRDRQARGSIGHSGEHLASYFGAMSDDAHERVVQDLVDLYPRLQNLNSQNLQGGWKELLLHEVYESQTHLMTRSRHINDGLLRILAIFAELHSTHSFLLFDEIENGINPELVEALLQKLTTSPHQVLVTTHSPMILNYLDDDLARESVVFLYKGPDGATRAKRFFDIPSISEKFEVMGPGEAFVDTNLVALTEELNAAATGA